MLHNKNSNFNPSKQIEFVSALEACSCYAYYQPLKTKIPKSEGLAFKKLTKGLVT